MKLQLVRGDRTINMTAVLADAGDMAETAAEAEDIHPRLAGATFSDYDGKSQSYDGKGVVVDSVATGSPAEFAGLEAGDVIVQLNNQEVESLRELRELAKDQSVLGMKIVRGNRVLLRVIR